MNSLSMPLAIASTLLDKLYEGGWTVGVQLAISVIALGFVLERLIHLRRKHVAPVSLAKQVDELWSAQCLESIRALCEAQPSTLSRMIAGALDHRHSPADASTVAADIGVREMKMHLQKAYPIAVAATLEPLLGLFGTVLGMIGAFDQVAALGEMGNASALSENISLALVTTAVGLAIAIPLLAMYHYFRSRTSLMAIGLEEQVSRLISRHIMSTPQTRPAEKEA